MTLRIAPKDGYDFPQKKHYRRNVWSFFRQHCAKPRAESHALLMPSLEGDEIEVALNNGFREYNLHIVDRNPAIVATVKRRFPKVSTYGVDVVSAIMRIPRGLIDVANIDLCGTISAEWVNTMQTVAWRLAPGGLLSMTYLVGRDPLLSAWPDRSTREDFIRRVLVLNDSPRRSGTYRTGSMKNINMGWMAGSSNLTRVADNDDGRTAQWLSGLNAAAELTIELTSRRALVDRYGARRHIGWSDEACAEASERFVRNCVWEGEKMPPDEERKLTESLL